MAKIISDEQKKINELKHFYENQKNKVFNYSIDDFDIIGGNWQHKDWKVWMKGDPNGNYSKTKKIVEKYIEECKKPYGQRDLSQFHLVSD
jgi:hypothetical protein